MKIHLDTKVLDLEGKEIISSDEILSLRKMAITALVSPLPADANEEAIKAFERYELARKIKNHKNDDFEIDPADATMLRQRIMKIYHPLAAGFAWELLKG